MVCRYLRLEKVLALRQTEHSAAQRELQLYSTQKPAVTFAISAFRNGTWRSVARRSPDLTDSAAASYARRVMSQRF